MFRLAKRLPQGYKSPSAREHLGDFRSADGSHPQPAPAQRPKTVETLAQVPWMSGKDQELIASINERLDARALIEAIGFETGRLVAIGGAIKTPCMIHGDRTAATLVVFLNKKSCKCLRPGCPANREMSLVELYSLHTGKPPASCALEAAELAGLHVSEEQLEGFAETHLAHAEQAIADGRHKEAWDFLEKARKIDPQNVDVALAAGRLAESEGRAFVACGEYVAAAGFAREQDRVEQAEAIMREHVLRIEPDKDDYLMELAALQRACDKEPEFLSTLFRVCSIREAEGRLAENVEIYELLSSRFDVQPELRLGFARALEAAGENERAIEQYVLASATMPHRNTAGRIEALQSITRLDPDNIEAREGLAAIHHQAGHREEAVALWCELGREAETADNLERSRVCYHKAITADPENPAGYEGLAAVYQLQDRPIDEQQARLDAAECHVHRRDAGAALLHLERVRQLDANNPRFLRLSGEAAILNGETDEGLTLLTEAGKAYLESNEPREAEKVLNRVLQLSPDDGERAIELAEFLREHGQRTSALQILRGALRRESSGEILLRREIVARILELDPADAAARESLAEVHDTSGETIEALASYLAAADAWSRRGEEACVERCLRHAQRIAPDDVSVRRATADFFRTGGRHADACEELRALAEIHVAREAFNEAIAVLDECLAIDTNDRKAQNRLAQLYLEKGEKELASVMFHSVARLLRADGNPSAAMAQLRRSCEVAPDNSEAQRDLIMWLCESGDWSAATNSAASYVQLLHSGGMQSEAEGVAVLVDELAEKNPEAIALFHAALLRQGLRLFACACLEGTIERLDEFEDARVGGVCRAADVLELPDSAACQRLYDDCRRRGLDNESITAALRLEAAWRQEKRFDDAEKLLQDLWEEHPASLDLLRGLAECRESAGKLKQAAQDFLRVGEALQAAEQLEEANPPLERAASLAPENAATHQRLGELQLRLGRQDKAITSLHRAARLLAQDTNPLEARPIYERVCELAPQDCLIAMEFTEYLEGIGDTEAWTPRCLATVELLLASNRRADAVALAERLAAARSVPMRARRQLGGLFEQHGQTQAAFAQYLAAAKARAEQHPGEAEEMFAEAARLTPNDPELLRCLAALYLATGRVAQAVKQLRQLADQLEAEGEIEQAATAWQELLAADEAHLEARERLAALYESGAIGEENSAVSHLARLAELQANAGDRGLAIATRKRVLRLDPANLECRDALARDYLAEDELEAARQEFLRLGAAWERQGDNRKAIDYHSKALELRPDDADTLAALVRTTRAEQAWQQFHDLSFRLAALHDRQGRLDEALEVCRGIIETDPSNRDARLLSASYLAARPEHKARAVTAYLETARLDLESGNPANVREVLGHVERLGPFVPETLEEMAALYLAIDCETEGLNHLRGAAHQLRKSGKLERALGVIDRILGVLPEDSDVLEEKAELLKALNRRDEAAGIWSRLVAAARSEALVRRAYQSILTVCPERLDDRRGYIEFLEQLGEKRQAAEQRLELAFLVMASDPDEADRLAAQAQIVLDDSPRLHELRGELGAARADDQEALLHWTWLGRYLVAERRYETALVFLERALSISPAEPELLALTATAAKSVGQVDEAVRRYSLLAGILAEAGDLAHAAEAMKLACELTPQDAALQARHAKYLLEEGETEQAINAYLQALRTAVGAGLVDQAQEIAGQLLEAPEADDHLHEQVAGVYGETGIPELAAKEYLELARRCESGDRLQEAKVWCRKSLDYKPRSVEARELLAGVHRRVGEPQAAAGILMELAEQFEESAALDKAAEALEAAASLAPDDIEANERLVTLYDRLGRFPPMAEALDRLVLIHSEQDRIEECLQALERLVELRPDDSRVRLQYIMHASHAPAAHDVVPHYLKLAELRAAKEEHDEAAEMFRHAIGADPTRPDSRMAFVRYLMRRGEASEALICIQELVELLVVREQYEEAEVLLKEVEEFGADEPALHLARAQVQRSRNARGMAIRDLQKAAELFGRRGEFEKMAHTLESALEIDPQNMESRRELVKVLRKLGRREQMAECQMQLAEIYVDRRLLDLAEAEYRAIVVEVPEHEAAWFCLFETQKQLGRTKQLADDYLAYADDLASRGQIEQALDYAGQAIRLDPMAIAAREKYIEIYLGIGGELELVEDFLTLADLYVTSGKIDEGIQLYSRIMELDPEHSEARDRLAETRTGRRPTNQAAPAAFHANSRPHEANAPRLFGHSSVAEKSDSWPTGVTPPPGEDSELHEASRFLADELDSLDGDDHEESLRQVIAHYEDMLAVNPQNAGVRIRLADLYEQISCQEEALDQLTHAVESLYHKGEVDTCIDVCERILRQRPSDHRIRQRLKQSYNKRDAFKALQSDILLPDSLPGEADLD